jgi:multidrug transporter EmrE-like cation transporter
VTAPDVVVPVSGTRIVVLACSVFALGLAYPVLGGSGAVVGAVSSYALG